MVTGGGHSRMEEALSVIGVPVMTKPSFINIERSIVEQWRKFLQKSMIEAGIEEKKLAIEKGDFHEGVPAITVVVDGGWISAPTSTHTMRSQVSPSLLGRKPGKYCILELGTSIVVHVPKMCPSKINDASSIGKHLPQKWNST